MLAIPNRADGKREPALSEANVDLSMGESLPRDIQHCIRIGRDLLSSVVRATARSLAVRATRDDSGAWLTNMAFVRETAPSLSRNTVDTRHG